MPFLSGNVTFRRFKVDGPRARAFDDSHLSRLAEHAAVRAGKLPRKAALTVVRHDDQFSFVLQAETLAVTALKLPAPPDDCNGRAREEHRLQAVRDCVEAADGMYASFLARRCGRGWESDLRDVRGWLRDGTRVGA